MIQEHELNGLEDELRNAFEWQVSEAVKALNGNCYGSADDVIIQEAEGAKHRRAAILDGLARISPLNVANYPIETAEELESRREFLNDCADRLETSAANVGGSCGNAAASTVADLRQRADALKVKPPEPEQPKGVHRALDIRFAF